MAKPPIDIEREVKAIKTGICACRPGYTCIGHQAMIALCNRVRDADPTGDAGSAVAALTDEQRVELFSRYCRSCGSNDRGCQCWNDE